MSELEQQDSNKNYIQIDEIVDYGANKKLISILKKNNLKEFREVQVLAIKKGLFNNVSQFICSPSGSGKTLIGELAAINNILEKKGKSLYLVPLRALAAEKRDYFIEMYSKYRINITMAIGDQVIPIEELNKANLLIMTYEKFDSYLRLIKDNKWINQIFTIIIDEIHLINEPRRGARLESIIIRLFLLLKQFQFITLSATIGNQEDLTLWFKTLCKIYNDKKFQTILYDKRPVPLKYSIIPTNNKIQTLFSLLSTVLKENNQTLIFTNSRQNAEELAELISNFVSQYITENDFTNINNQEVIKVLKPLIEANIISERLLNLIKKGTAFHHGGLEGTIRYVIEKLFLLGKIKVIVCTTTLSAGINTPAKMVILYDLELYNQKLTIKEDEKISKEINKSLLSKNILHQILGRAGRPGFDNEGIAHILVNNEKEAINVQNFYFKSIQSEQVNEFIPSYNHVYSRLVDRKNLMEFILLLIYDQKKISLADLYDLFNYNFANFIESSNIGDIIHLQIEDLKLFQLVVLFSSNESLLKLCESYEKLQYNYNITQFSDKKIEILIDIYEKDYLKNYKIIFDINKGIYCTCDQNFFRLNFDKEFNIYMENSKNLEKKFTLCFHRVLALNIFDELVLNSKFFIIKNNKNHVNNYGNIENSINKNLNLQHESKFLPALELYVLNKEKTNDLNNTSKEIKSNEFLIEISNQNPLYFMFENENNSKVSISRILAECIIEKLINQSIRGNNLIEQLLFYNYLKLNVVTVNKKLKIKNLKNKLDFDFNEDIELDKEFIKDFLEFEKFYFYYSSFDDSSVILKCSEAGKCIIRGYIYPHTTLIFEKLLAKEQNLIISIFSNFPCEIFMQKDDDLKENIIEQILTNNPNIKEALVKYFINLILNLYVQEDRQLPSNSFEILKMRFENYSLTSICEEFNNLKVKNNKRFAYLYLLDLKNFIDYSIRILNFIKDYVNMLLKNVQNDNSLIKYYSIILYFLDYFINKLQNELNLN